MFASLLTASLKREDIRFIARVPRMVLNELEKEAVAFIVDYERKYGRPPSVERFESEKEGKFALYITTYMIKEPLQDLYDQCINSKKEDYFYGNMRMIEESLEGGSDLSPQDIIRIGRDLQTLEMMDHESVYSVDRDSLYSEEIPRGLRFGFEVLDRTIGGVLDGEYGILVARPGVGKTMVLCFLVVRWLREGKRVLFISCEMPVPAIVARLDGIVGGFNPRLLRTKDDPAKLKEMRGKVDSEYDVIKAHGGDILFPRSRMVSVNNLLALIDEHRPDAVVVDGVYLMRTNEGSSLSDWQKVKAVSNELKQLALTENVPIFATSQLKRSGKEDGFNTEDIAYSDSLSQDADIIIAGHRRAGLNNQMMLDIIKNRNGDGMASTTIHFKFDVMAAEEIAWDDSVWDEEEEDAAE